MHTAGRTKHVLITQVKYLDLKSLLSCPNAAGLRVIGTLFLIHVWDHKNFISPLLVPPTEGQAFATLMFLTNLSDQLFFSHGLRWDLAACLAAACCLACLAAVGLPDCLLHH